MKGAEDYVDKSSVLGGRSDAISQGVGQVAAILLTGGAAGAAGLGGAGATALTTAVTGLSGMGSGMSQAYQEGATDGEAVAYGAIAGTAEALTEWIFAGMGKSVKALGFSKGLSSADDILAKKLSSKISSQLGKNLVELGVKAGAEGTEEVLSGIAQAFGKKLTYMSEEDLGKIVKDERLFDQFLTGAITSGIAQSGIVPGMKAGSFREANQTGRDLITGLTQNEQAVVDKEFADRLAERKKSGELSKKQEAELYDKVLEDMEQGRISTDIIESVLGGDTYKGYQDALVQESKLKKEIEELESLPDNAITVKQRERLVDARKELEGLDTKTAKSNLFTEVDKLTAKDTKLRESYNERTRRGQAFTADLTKYDAKQQETVKRAVESGILNNTNRTHEFVDLIAKISASKGVSFNFADNAKLKESGFAIDGKQVNGFVAADGVTININSAKALNSVVGHEITHVLEGTELYTELQSAITEYAKSKGDYQGRFDALTELYKDIEGADIDAELTADLVGDYLFTDADFIQRLSTEHRGVFQKLFDEIKHLCKLATAGTKEARELEKVKKLFEDAYRTETKNPTKDGGVKYALGLQNPTNTQTQYDYTKSFADQINDFQNGKFPARDTLMLGGTPKVLKEIGLIGLPMTINQKHIGDALNGTYKGTPQEVLDHTFTPKELATLPEKIADPIAVIYDKRTGKANASESTVDVIVEMTAASGKQVLVAVQVGGNSHINGLRIDTNKVATVHGNTDCLTRLVDAINETEKGNVAVFYINNDKTTKVLQSAGNPIPRGLSNLDGFITSINDPGSPVKSRFSDVTETQQFKRWFGDWQNHPENASKVVNDDGTPKIVYHGSDSLHSVFSYGNIGSASGTPILGEGFYFTDDAELAKGYGKNVYECYLEIKTPYYATEADVYKLNSNTLAAQGYDGVILKAPAGNVYMTIDNTQIKSATDNIGTFDGSNPDIRYSLSEQDTAQVGDYRITGEDVALAPTKEDIARMEQGIATAQTAPHNDTEELGAPTREDIARMDRDKMLKGPLLMKDSLDRELEKLYRLQQLNQIQDNAYFVELFKVNAAYQEAGRDFTKAFNRVIGAYQTETVAGTEAGKTNAVTKPLSSYPAEKQNAIRSYLQSVDEQIKAFVKRVKDGDLRFERRKVSDVNERAASDIQELLGIDVSGYTHNINTSGVQHILRRHGKNGKQDSTMSVDDDIARVGWVLDNYDSVELLTKDGQQVYSSEFKDKDNNPVPQIRFIKKIDGTYYVVEAACENEYQKLWVQSAYLQKNEDVTQVSAEGQEANHKTYAQGELASPSSDNSIFQNVDDVKYSLDQSVEDEIGAPTREDILRMEAEKELHGPWRMTDELDQKVEKLYRMMLREQVSEEDYIAQLVKADRQYHQRGSRVEEALERVREAYSKETTETPETEKKMERLTRKVLHKGIMDRIRDALAKAGFDMNTILKNAKNLSTFATVDNTPQRVNEKTFGYKAGQIINDLTINKAALNESDGIQWLNSQIDKIRKMSERYGIKPGSKESRAAQIYGEGFWVNEVGEYIQYGDAELAADFPDTEKQAKIKALAKSQEVRQMYDETLDAINAARVRNGYPPIPRRDNYFLHYRAQDDTFSKIGVPFNPNDVRAKDLPTDLNGVTADLKPGKPFFASEMHRTGDKTTYDLLGGLERYMNSAKNQIYHIDDIQTFRAMRNYIADMFGQANGLADLDSLSPEEQEQRIKEVFDNHLSTYAKFLNEEANIFAGKTALIDRGVEGVLGRRAIQFLHTVNGQVGKNMVGYNISSAGTNVLPVVQATAMLPKADMVKAFAQTISNKFRNDGFVESDPALIRRKGADQFAKTPWQRISDPGYALMSAVDDLSSELVVRAKYNELTRKGMDSQQAHIRAGEWAMRLMGDRSLGQMPQLYNSKTLGLITKFQLEVRNQLDAMGYDVIQEAKAEEGASNAKKAVKVASTMAQLAIFQHLFGQAYESIAGYNPAFDIVENLIKLFGFDDEEESEDTFGDNVEQAFLGLLEDLPYTSTFTGGRIPIASALPIEEVITGKDSYGNEKSRIETLAEALPYYVLPGGYGQAKKTAAGLKMFDDDFPVSGSYTDSGNLRFPVEDTAANRVQAALFGQYASKNAREYFDNGWAPLKEKQIEEFVALDIPIADYREIRNQLGKLETTGEKFDYIDSLDLTVEQKNILVNNVVDRKEPVDMTDYDLYEDFEEFDFYTKNQEKYQFLKDNGIAYKTYNASEESRAAYNWAFQNPEKYQVSLAVTEDAVVYRQYAKDLNAIQSDKDSKGNAVSGSRKKKVVQYINGLDMEYGAKLVLYKMEYPSDDSYNGKIIQYVNGIEGFSYKQKTTVLKELGFTVTSDGRVTWN